MKLKTYFSTVFAFCLPIIINGQTLEKQIKKIADKSNATVGVAVIIDGRDTLTVNNHEVYPLMSVVKFHQALAVAHTFDKANETFDRQILIQKEDLHENTYSPLREKYPQGNIRLSIKELLRYTLQLSDNNACDILFKRITDIPTTDNYLRTLGVSAFSIAVNENDMHLNPDTCHANWSTPLETAILFEKLFTEKLFAPHLQNFLKQTLMECRTGANRLAAPLTNTGAAIAHKTGTGDKNRIGKIIAINDAGFVQLPDGQHYSIAVFVKDSGESPEQTEKIIADISETVYKHISKQH